MHMLITGGAGFIGSHLAEALLAQGHTVTAVDNLSTGRYANLAGLIGRPDFQFVHESIANETVMDRLVSACSAIFHLAAAVGVELIVKNPVATLETNIQGTEMILRLARRYRRQVLLASTSEVYGKSTQVPFQEDADRVMGPTARSRWSYAESKAIDEFLGLAYHRQFDVPVMICRFFNTVGPRQTGAYGMVVPRLVQQALAGQPLTVYGTGQQTRCFCNVRDTVRAVWQLAATPQAVGEIYNVGSQEEITIGELAERVRARTGSAAPIDFIPYEQAYEKGFEDMQRRVPSIDKIRAAIGWQPTILLDQTLDEVIADFRQAGSDRIESASPGADS
ncbi:MAG: GDP-mannose 4,6-dehydratase [Anaerolineales bacterium]|nr:GDP-mannose 4,6-dehydratase [Anaerolineales bacterium]